MSVIIEQRNEEISSGIERLMKMSKTNLTEICEDNNLVYAKTYRKLKAAKISVEFVESIVKMINKKAKVKSDFNLSLMLQDKILINHKS